jgi:hypothetical protein
LICVANGAAAPTTPSKHIVLWKVVTDAADITSTTDLRQMKAMPGDHLLEGSGPLTHVSSGGVLDSLANVTTKNLGLITDDGAGGYNKVTGVDPTSHQVQTTSIANSAVDTAQIAADAVERANIASGAVNTAKITANVSRAAINYNGCFSDWNDV